jgi:gamma-glutamyltranspeptidase/glutathione hydrolase
MKIRMNGIARVALLAMALMPNHVAAQAIPPLSVCIGEAKPAACDATRGDRADGWRAQSRAEVMAPAISLQSFTWRKKTNSTS